jgi:hypothetical protein
MAAHAAIPSFRNTAYATEHSFVSMETPRNGCRAVRNLRAIRAGARGLPLLGECCFVNTLKSLAATVESSSKLIIRSDEAAPNSVEKRRQIIFEEWSN